LVYIISDHRFTSLWRGKTCPLLTLLLRFAVYVSMWSIVAIRAFREPGRCDVPAIEAFPPTQKPSLEETVLMNLVETWDVVVGVNMARCNTDEAVIHVMQTRRMQLNDWMYAAVASS